uniref:Secreted protein n=1 Tax=Rhabditophanes sp. KR3021 TaxID=114890 RepID=A0AC35TZA7_9BILA
MQKFALVCLLALAISTVYCGSSSSSGSSEGKRNKKQKDCSEDLVEETGPSGECMLIESLYNCSSQLTDPADILIFNQFIFELNFTLFASNNY